MFRKIATLAIMLLVSACAQPGGYQQAGAQQRQPVDPEYAAALAQCPAGPEKKGAVAGVTTWHCPGAVTVQVLPRPAAPVAAAAAPQAAAPTATATAAAGAAVRQGPTTIVVNPRMTQTIVQAPSGPTTVEQTPRQAAPPPPPAPAPARTVPARAQSPIVADI